jgi:hypothetical protein
MATLEIPVRSDNKAYSLQVDLEGTRYTLRFRFNTRMGRWVMDIADSVNTDILNGVVLLTNYPLTDQYADTALPPGRFVCIDESGENKDPGTNDLGNDVKLLYEEAS